MSSFINTNISRRLFLGQSAAFSLATALGCNALAQDQPASQADANLKFMQNYDGVGNEFFTEYVRGGKEAAEALGLQYSESISDFSASKQRSIFEDAITKGYGSVSMKSLDEGSSPTLIKLLTQSDIKVVNSWATAPWTTPSEISENYVGYFAPSDFIGARAMARALFKAMGGKGNLVHITGIKGLTHDTERTSGVDAALAEFPDIKLVARRPGKYNRVDSQAVMENILNSSTDIGGVFCQNDDGAIGVIKALKDRSNGTKLPLVAGIDAIAEMLDAIEEGTALGTWACIPRYGSAFAAVRAFDAVNGYKPSVPELMMGWGTLIIDNAQSSAAFRKLMASPTSPWDWRKMSRVLNPDSWDPQNMIVPLLPADLWARRESEKPSGYALPEQYADAAAFKAVRDDYLTRAKGSDPLREICEMTTFKEPILAN